MRRKTHIVIGLLLLTMIATACEKKQGEIQETTQGKVTTETTEEETTGADNADEDKYTADMGNAWKYAYSDGQYNYYYMNVTEDVHDSNIILSITEDETLKGADGKTLENSLIKQYEAEEIDTLVTLVNDYQVVYLEMEAADGDVEAKVGQYIILGKNRGIIISVYAEKNKFNTAKENAEKVVETIKIND